jgi:hypothetical protein
MAKNPRATYCTRELSSLSQSLRPARPLEERERGASRRGATLKAGEEEREKAEKEMRACIVV